MNCLPVPLIFSHFLDAAVCLVLHPSYSSFHDVETYLFLHIFGGLVLYLSPHIGICLWSSMLAFLHLFYSYGNSNMFYLIPAYLSLCTLRVDRQYCSLSDSVLSVIDFKHFISHK